MSGWGVGGRHGALCSCDDAVNVNQRLQCSALEVWGWSSVVSGRWLCVSVWEGGQRGLVYQLHSDTLSKALCVLPLRESCCEPPHGSAFMHDDSHMPHRSPMLPSAPLLSSPVAKDELTTSYFTNRWGFGSKHHFNVFLSQSHLLLSICKPIRGLLTNSCIVEVRPRGKIFFFCCDFHDLIVMKNDLAFQCQKRISQKARGVWKQHVCLLKSGDAMFFAQQQEAVYQILTPSQIEIDNLAPFSNCSNRAECIHSITLLKTRLFPEKGKRSSFTS